jgi:hypothetical protein
MTTIDIDAIVLAPGAHRDINDGACLLEVVSYVAGEPWSDHPECVCPVLGRFGRAWNDALDEETRNRILKPFIPKLIGTRSTPDVQDRRAFMAADWAVRTYTPVWLREIGLNDEAAALEQLPEMTSVELCKAAMPTIAVARKQTDAAWAAARDATWAATRAATWDAARDAARERLAPLVTLLQVSAADLFERMIAVEQ